MSAGPVANVERALSRLGDDPFNAFTHVAREAAFERARRLEAEGPQDRPLWGRVVSVKDNIAARGMPMTCGSRHLAEYVAPYDATVVARLLDAGAIVIGKTNMDEFAAGSSGENSAFGPTLNPRDPTRVAGGSSSGAGASVASGVVELALGSDTGGSVRAPASFCGVAAFRPSHGRVPRHGLADLAMSLESPAPIARTVRDLAVLLDATAGADPRDPRTAGAPRPRFAETLAKPLEGLRIGVPSALFEGVAPDVRGPVERALAKLEAAGARATPVDLPGLAHALSAYYVLNYAEFASAMQRLDGIRYGRPGPVDVPYEASAAASRASFGPEVKRRILLGTFVTSREERGRWYDSAVAARGVIAEAFARALADVDVLVGPTMPVRAFRVGERVTDPREMYAADALTVSANLADVPAGSVPVEADGLPVGLQVIGRRGEDERALAAMAFAERHAGARA
ncbi:MAG TPA: amidase family protein [Candidatus Thermoplasmatota archaeon]|nr:amidase family protein [Candidatus Thermoplasmatota archaeon]